MLMQQDSTWLLFPPPCLQEPSYPRATENQRQLSGIGTANSADPLHHRRETSGQASHLVWWERSASSKLFPSPAPIKTMVPMVGKLQSQECDDMTHIPRNLSHTSPNLAYWTADVTESGSTSSADTVLRSPSTESRSECAFSRRVSSSFDQEASDKENTAPPESKSLVARPAHLPSPNPERHLGSRRQTPLYTALANSRRPSTTVSRQVSISASLTQSEELQPSPAISPRIFLRRSIPSISFLKTPLAPASSDPRIRVARYDLVSHVWSSFTAYSDDQVLARHTFCLDVILQGRWVTKTVLIDVIVEGLSADGEICATIQGGRADLPPVRSPMPQKSDKSTLVLEVSRDDLKATLFVNISIIYEMTGHSADFTLPMPKPPTGRVTLWTQSVQNPKKPLIVSRNAKVEDWSICVHEAMTFWRISSIDKARERPSSPQGHPGCRQDYAGMDRQESALRTVTLKRLVALELSQLLHEADEAPFAWHYCISVGNVGKVSMLCRLHINIAPVFSWAKPLLAFDPCNWDMTDFLLDDDFPKQQVVWYISDDGSLTLIGDPTFTNPAGRMHLEIGWELSWDTIDAFNLNEQGLTLPMLRSHRVLNGVVSSFMPNALIKTHHPKSGRITFSKAEKAILPILQPDTTLSIVFSDQDIAREHATMHDQLDPHAVWVQQRRPGDVNAQSENIYGWLKRWLVRLLLITTAVLFVEFVSGLVSNTCSTTYLVSESQSPHIEPPIFDIAEDSAPLDKEEHTKDMRTKIDEILEWAWLAV